jgi:hypothetical protein
MNKILYENNIRRNIMALFKKLNEEIKKSEIKQNAFNLSEKEKRALEQEIIFGNILEELDVDNIELQYKKNKEEQKC